MHKLLSNFLKNIVTDITTRKDNITIWFCFFSFPVYRFYWLRRRGLVISRVALSLYVRLILHFICDKIVHGVHKIHGVYTKEERKYYQSMTELWKTIKTMPAISVLDIHTQDGRCKYPSRKKSSLTNSPTAFSWSDKPCLNLWFTRLLCLLCCRVWPSRSVNVRQTLMNTWHQPHRDVPSLSG